jgi:hypothetical protein
VNIGTSKTGELPLNRPARVIIAASDEQKGQTRVSTEFGLSRRQRDENSDPQCQISVRIVGKSFRTNDQGVLLRAPQHGHADGIIQNDSVLLTVREIH